MMIVLDISPELYEQALELVGSKYPSIDKLMEVSLQNQVSLERIHGGTGDPAKSEVAVRSLLAGIEGSPREIEEVKDASEWRNLVTRLSEDAVAPLVETTPVVEGTVLWGQVNRLLPAVCGVRVLANMLTSQTEPFIAISDWHKKSTEVAIAWGRHLERLDTSAGRKRGEQWATAFPTQDSASSRRYVNQFLGWPSQGGETGGAEVLQLVAFEEAKQTRVGLTPAGVRLVALENPIFDLKRPHQTLSIPEARFFLEHLQRCLPNEYRFLEEVAALIEEGLGVLELNETLGNVHPEWSKFIGTMRGGAIGRLTDLGLVERKRKGQHVDYVLAELAEDLGLRG